MQNTPWRHTIAVSLMAVVLVTLMVYCITPDLLDKTLLAALDKTREYVQARLSHTLGGAILSGGSARHAEPVAAAESVPPVHVAQAGDAGSARDPADECAQDCGQTGAGDARALGEAAGKLYRQRDLRAR